jgi:ribonuclease BN (tRNA processing enzyme)
MKVIHHASGSSGNAFHIDRIQIDSGVKTEEETDLLLITHAHIDHIRYITDSLGATTHFYTTPMILQSIYDKIAKWAVKKQNTTQELILEKLIDEETLQETYDCQAFELNHDVPCVGYRIKDYVHISDTGAFNIPDSIRNQRFYTIESNYDETELELSGRPLELIDRIKATHLSNEQAIALAQELNAKEVMFVHLSDETNSHDLAQITHEIEAPKIKKHYPKGKEDYDC